MTYGARTPEELATLLEDAFVVHDEESVAELFEARGLLVATGSSREARGRDEIARIAREMWDADEIYTADAERVLQAGDVALVLGARTVSVTHRGEDATWRFAIAFVQAASRQDLKAVVGPD